MSLDAIMAQWDTRTKEQVRPSFNCVSDKATLIAEVGVHKGWNARAMLEKRPNIKAILIDDLNPEYPTMRVTSEPFTRSQRDAWILRMGIELASVKDRIQFIFKDSLTAIKLFGDESFDYVYLDNDRDTERIAAQMTAWWPKIKPGGILAGSGINLESIKKALNIAFPKGYKAHNPDWWIGK